MYTLHLLKNFDNYANRRLIIRATINDYITDEDIFIGTFEKRNFVFGDGIQTTHIINYVGALPTPSYIIVENETDHSFTRWFVTNCNENRGCQYTLTLKRDSVADYFENIKSSNLLIKKGWVGNDNVLVFNSEPQNYNKIKTNELLIKDKTQSGYVIGFISSNVSGSSSDKIYTNYKDSVYVDFDYSDLDSDTQDYFVLPNGTPVSTTTAVVDDNKGNICLSYNYGLQNIVTSGLFETYTIYDGTGYVRANGTKNKLSGTTDNRSNRNGYYYTTSQANSTLNPSSNCYATLDYENGVVPSNFLDVCSNGFSYYIASRITNKDISSWYSLLGLSNTKKESLKYYDGKICNIGGTYYQCHFVPTNKRTINVSGLLWSAYTINQMRDIMPPSNIVNTFAQNGYGDSMNYATEHDRDALTINDMHVQAYVGDYYIQLSVYEKTAYTYLTPTANRQHLSDAPYDMFVIPYTNGFTYEVNATEYVANQQMALNLAQQICLSLGSSEVYDIQIVPFCPFQTTAVQDDLDFSLENSQAIYDTNDVVIGYYFWAYNSSLNFSIKEERELLTLQNSSYTYKEISQLRDYILCSPNKDSTYGFNPCMNNGIFKWNISFDYRPFSSYVKIQPQWNWLYGEEYYNSKTDTRGLVFNGAYSITQLSNAWANYVASNKNYQQIFDTNLTTQITKFDKQQKAQWDTVGMRNYSLFPVSSVLKIIGESKQMDYDREIFNIDTTAQRQIFNYQLDNIQSQPYAISKLTSLNSDFRVFPYIEVYDASPKELDLFRDMIKFNGMTIMTIGYIGEYLKPNDETFIQASIIRFSDFIGVENSYRLVSDINQELTLGIYVKEE